MTWKRIDRGIAVVLVSLCIVGLAGGSTAGEAGAEEGGGVLDKPEDRIIERGIEEKFRPKFGPPPTYLEGEGPPPGFLGQERERGEKQEEEEEVELPRIEAGPYVIEWWPMRDDPRRGWLRYRWREIDVLPVEREVFERFDLTELGGLR